MAGNKTNPDTASAVVGGPTGHIPVMLHEVLHALQPAEGMLFVDGTFGAGGYTNGILENGSSVFAIDRDPDATRAAEDIKGKHGARFQFASGEFGRMDDICKEAGIENVDGVVLDIGVSSMQIDEAQRGFSFQKDGPLDMRMGQSGMSAADLVNNADGKDLTRIIGILGEERHAGRVSRAIVARRADAAISSTLDLARLIEKTLGRKHSDRIHPATRTFQALRIFVNRELAQLAKGLFAAETLLKSGGKLVVVTFHSLEDRIVKQFFVDRCGGTSGSRHMPQINNKLPCFKQEKRGATSASDKEANVNPRARSAKLRWATRLDTPAREADYSLFGNVVNLSLSGAVSNMGEGAFNHV